MKYEFFKDDDIKSLEESMERMLKFIGESHYNGDRCAVEYFKSEYWRLREIHRKRMEEWLDAW